MQFDQLNWREFITLLGGAAAMWPVALAAQPPDRKRRLGMLMGLSANDSEAQARRAAFLEELQKLGWTEGVNLQIDTRWAAGDDDRFRKYAGELVPLAPDVIFATSSPAVGALLRVSRSVPIVFLAVSDPVGAGFVDSLARPGGNVTGFMPYEFGISVKWIELLKEIAPRITRAAVLRDANNPSAMAQFATIQAVAPSLGVEIVSINVREDFEIENAVAAFARTANGGLIVAGSPATVTRRKLISALAIRHRLPVVDSDRAFVTGGGLISYGPDRFDPYRRAAGYVDRILRGEKPAYLPVQAPTKYELVLNLKTAKALGLDVPATVLARADEVIE